MERRTEIKCNLMNEWKNYTIKDIGSVVTGNTPPKKDPENYGGNLVWIKPPDLDKRKFVSTSEDTISEIGKKKVRLLPKGSVLVSCIGNIGKIAISDCELCTNQQINSIIPNKDIVDPIFLYYAIKRMKPYLEKIASSAVVPLLNKNDFSKVNIKLPPLETQKKIVEILEKAEKLKEWRAEVDELADEYLKSVFLEMFGNPLTNSKGWNLKELKEFGEIKTGNTPSRKISEYYGDYIEWIKSDNINTPFTYLTTSEERLSKEGSKVARIVPKGSILVTCIAGSISCLGNVAVTDRNVAFNQQINSITPKGVNELFLYHLILYTKHYLQNFSRSALKGIINKTTFESIPMIYPPNELQEQFGKIVQQVETLKTHQTQSKQKIDNLFNTLMQKAFKGELVC
ncbi:MAG: restriction endonuclease subunit S [Methanobacteriaceae archaeon]|nr:restriction endonuclease subunit S [Methanobacteriaceae archaeon]MDO9626857.1 restriction endonuclease subunit S [Methanobacteriaceae archaeon]